VVKRLLLGGFLLSQVDAVALEKESAHLPGTDSQQGKTKEVG
jgi:hypothetical protein